VRVYWRGLLRGNAKTPFWDDLRMSELGSLAEQAILLDVFERPERFRFNSIGGDVGRKTLAGLFIDETDLTWPFEFLRSQSSATVEAAAPTLYAFSPGAGSPAGRPYRRLLLPLWGEGHVSMLLGAFEFG
jgi:hypothetical protein